MSGTSIDGIDLCYCSFTIDKVWSYKIIKCETVVYDAFWVNKLSQAISLSKSGFSDISKVIILRDFLESRQLVTKNIDLPPWDLFLYSHVEKDIII